MDPKLDHVPWTPIQIYPHIALLGPFLVYFSGDLHMVENGHTQLKRPGMADDRHGEAEL